MTMDYEERYFHGKPQNSFHKAVNVPDVVVFPRLKSFQISVHDIYFIFSFEFLEFDLILEVCVLSNAGQKMRCQR